MEPLLAFDTGSATVSVAVGVPGQTDVMSAPQGRSSRELIGMIDELLAGAGLTSRDLGGIAAARGPGSFTGLRVGLATALGLHQATGVRAGAMSTLELLAAHYVDRVGPDDGAQVLAIVDAHRDRWFAQPFRKDNGGVSPLEAPAIRERREIEACPLPLIGHGASGLSAQGRTVEAAELAPTLLHGMATGSVGWTADDLTQPLYLRSPATSPSSRPPGTPRPGRRRRRNAG